MVSDLKPFNFNVFFSTILFEIQVFYKERSSQKAIMKYIYRNIKFVMQK